MILLLSLTVLLIVTVLLIFTCYIHLYVCVCHTELKIFVFVFVFVRYRSQHLYTNTIHELVRVQCAEKKSACSTHADDKMTSSEACIAGRSAVTVQAGQSSPVHAGQLAADGTRLLFEARTAGRFIGRYGTRRRA